LEGCLVGWFIAKCGWHLRPSKAIFRSHFSQSPPPPPN
jgi:hypothetical protein